MGKVADSTSAGSTNLLLTICSDCCMVDCLRNVCFMKYSFELSGNLIEIDRDILRLVWLSLRRLQNG